MRQFDILWFKNEKFGNPIERKTNISGVEGSQAALQVFISANGNLKKNTIISIQEIDKDGNPIGEPIVPMDIEEEEPIKLTK